MSAFSPAYDHEEDMMTEETEINRTCDFCGVDINDRAPQARYCSNAHRQLTYNQRNDRSLGPVTRECDQCGVEFTAATPRGRYCSSSCRRKAWSASQKDS